MNQDQREHILDLMQKLARAEGNQCGNKCVEPQRCCDPQEVLTPAEKREHEIEAALEAMRMGDIAAQAELDAAKAEAPHLHFIAQDDIEAAIEQGEEREEIAMYLDSIATCLAESLKYRYGIELPTR